MKNTFSFVPSAMAARAACCCRTSRKCLVQNIIKVAMLCLLSCIHLSCSMKLSSENGQAGDKFGVSASISGNHMVIGAFGSGSFTGAAYIFLFNESAWAQEAVLTASDGGFGDKFGKSVSMSGNRVIIGSPYHTAESNNQGAAYVFSEAATVWVFDDKFVASDASIGDNFGWSVAIFGDCLIIGAHFDDGNYQNQGSVYSYALNGMDVWTAGTHLMANDGLAYDEFGFSVALSGSIAAIGAIGDDTGLTNQGSVYIFTHVDNVFVQEFILAAVDGGAGDSFGYSVAVHASYVLVGSPFADLGAETDIGAAYLFLSQSDLWVSEKIIKPSNGTTDDKFGHSVAMNESHVMIGSPFRSRGSSDEGSVYFIDMTSWAEVEVFPSNSNASDQFGYSVALDGGYSVSGCVSCDPLNDQGAAFVLFYYDEDQEWGFACPAGQYYGSKQCNMCPAGTYNDQISQDDCDGCPEGKYNPDAGSIAVTDCLDCVPGRYADSLGSPACDACQAGTYSGEFASTGCDDCPAGSYSEDLASACTLCQVNTFQDAPGQSFCNPCPLGTCTIGLIGKLTCLACGVGINQVSGCTVSSELAIATNDCPTIGGVVISITVDEAVNTSKTMVTIGDLDCPVIDQSDLVINCTLPAGVGKDVTVLVTDLNSGNVSTANLLSYSLAEATRVDGCDDSETLPHPDGTSACSRDGNDEVTVSGINFGPDQASVLVAGFKGVQIPLAARGLSGWEQNTTIVQVPAGSGLGVGVNVLQKGGELSDGVRMLSYKSCDPGFYNLRNESTGIYDCVECASGYYNLASESFSCEICPSGSYCSSSSVLSCDSILSGSSSEVGSSDPSKCTCPSSFLDFGGSCLCKLGEGYDGSTDSCLGCAIGQYKVDYSLDSCTTCSPSLTTTNGTRSTSLSDCICISNLEMINGTCVCPPGSEYSPETSSCLECGIGEYKDTWGLDNCVTCTGEYSTTIETASSTSSDCVCIVDYVDSDANEWMSECVKCPQGMKCTDVGTVLSFAGLRSGFWRESSTDLSTRECPYEDACTGSSDVSNQCVEGHSGPLCAVCEDGYTSANSNSKCETCYSSTHLETYVVIFVFLFVVFAILAAKRLYGNKTSLARTLKLFLLYIDSPGIRVRLRVTLAYLQIIGAFQSVLTTNLPENYAKFLIISQMTSLSFGAVFSPRCVNPGFNSYDELIAQTVSPIIVGIAILLAFVPSLLTSDKEKKSLAIINLWSWIFFSSFIFFPSASTAVFQIFNCDDDFESGSSYLKADYRLECDGPEYEGYRGYALLMMLVYPIGIPLFYFVILFVNRSIINCDADELCERLGSAGKAAVPQDIQRYYGDYGNMLNNVAMASNGNREAAYRFRREVGRRFVIEHARLSAIIAYAPLFEAYRPEVWYFECVECVRRLSLTGLLVFMYPGNEKQIWLAMMTCMFWIILYTWHRPYLSPSHNSFMMAAQWGVLLQLYGVLLITGNVFGGHMNLIGGLMIMVGSTVLLVPLIRSPDAIQLMRDIAGMCDRIKNSDGVSRFGSVVMFDDNDRAGIVRCM